MPNEILLVQCPECGRRYLNVSDPVKCCGETHCTPVSRETLEAAADQRMDERRDAEPRRSQA